MMACLRDRRRAPACLPSMHGLGPGPVAGALRCGGRGTEADRFHVRPAAASAFHSSPAGVGLLPYAAARCAVAYCRTAKLPVREQQE